MRREKKLIAHALIIALAGGCMAGGCGNNSQDGTASIVEENTETISADSGNTKDMNIDSETTEAGDGDSSGNVYVRVDEEMNRDFTPAVYEAEAARLLGGTQIAKEGETSYIEGFAGNDDGIELKIEVPFEGFYDINVISRSADGGHKENYLTLDGESMGTLKVEGREFTDSKARRIYMTAGEHTLTIMTYWGWININRIEISRSEPLDDARFDIEPVLVNPDASDNTRRLMKYMCDIYGTDILSGQYCTDGMYGRENQAIFKTTGEYPAILGLDLIEYSPSRAANGSSSKAIEHAIDYWEEGGIVSFCWHWNAPEKYLTGIWYSGFYAEHTNIDLAKIMDGEDEEGYALLNADIDAIAQQLLRLKEADVPILWRPLHEAGGGWFWWGASGPEAYKKLYILLYDRLTNEYGLNNLIWIWNGQDKEWYPGDGYVDIIGEDIYPGERVYTPQTSKYLEVLEYTDEGKMIVLSENGCLFDPDLAMRDGSMWGHFATWNGEFVLKNSELEVLSEQYTETEMLKKVYGHEHVITRDELPDLKNYPLE